MKSKFFIAFYLTVFISLTDTGFSADTSSVKFMPLSVGNMWVYDYYTSSGFQYSTVTRVVSDTVINSRRYYKLVGALFNGLYRCDTNTGSFMMYGGPNNCGYYTNESLVDSFSVQSGMYSCSNLNSGSQTANQIVLNTNVPTFTRAFATGNSNGQTKFGKYIGLYHDILYMLNVPFRWYTLRGARINGVKYGDTSGVTGINIVSSEIPEAFSLSQNYPNPFNPATKIRFSLPSTSYTKLVVYNLLGAEVAELFNSELQPGTYETVWNAEEYASGIYFYKLTANDFVETKKMVLMK